MAEKDKKLTKTASVASDKKEAINTAMKNIEKMYGKGSIMRLGDQTNLNVEVIPTGSLALDLALGIGGVPKGRIVEIYGPESSGKIFINQLREKVGVMYGNPEVTTGGRALKFYASVRIDVRRVETLKSSGELIGNRTRAKVVKNKMAPPFREAEFDIMYGEGISRLGELLDLAVKLELVQKSGSWFSMGETRLGQGRDAAKQYLKDNPEAADNLEAAIRRDFFKLMSSQSQVAAKAAGRAIDVSAEDFDDEP